jgi:hypothetical protein
MPTSSRSYGDNRNLVIIANIERQFWVPMTRKKFTTIFGKHRKKSAMITHLKIQYALGLGIATLFIFCQFIGRVLPGIHAPAGNFELSRSLPYLAATAWAIFLWFLRKNRIDSYQEFLENSPGIVVKTAGIRYGIGHLTEVPTEVPAEPPAPEPENPPVAQP